MRSFAQLNRSILDAIQSGRIGRPVFVRCMAGTEPGHAAALSTLLELLASVRQWIGFPIYRLYASESPDRAQITITVQFHGGTTALIGTVSTGTESPEPVSDLLILGNHGAIYHDGLTGRSEGEAPAFRAEHPPDRALEIAIEAAIRSGKPQTLLAEERP